MHAKDLLKLILDKVYAKYGKKSVIDICQEVIAIYDQVQSLTNTRALLPADPELVEQVMAAMRTP